jgi:hypothetical protein
MRRVLYIVGLVALVAGLAPGVSLLIASAVAAAAGCTLHEGFASPCPVLGVDLGGALYVLFASGWFLLVTMPLAVLGAGLLLVMGLIDLLHWARSSR